MEPKEKPIKKTALVIGGGAVGTIVALNLEASGLVTVTMVLRSNYDVVAQRGYQILSRDYGRLEGWRPSKILPTIPTIASPSPSPQQQQQQQQTEPPTAPSTSLHRPPYDFVILATKNIPDIPPTSLSLLAPALPQHGAHTTLILYQNGLNIEKPFLHAYPDMPVLSAISMIGSHESSPGRIRQSESENVKIGAFARPQGGVNGQGADDAAAAARSSTTTTAMALASRRAQDFVAIYAAAGRATCTYSPDVLRDRWRKLVFNAVLNPVCALTQLDTGRIRLADGAVEALVRPAMEEIVEAARVAAKVVLEEDVVLRMVEADPLQSYVKPSMVQDLEKDNFIEFENLLGEPLREGKRAGVPMPITEVLYQLTKAIQWRNREKRGLVEIPEKKIAD